MADIDKIFHNITNDKDIVYAQNIIIMLQDRVFDGKVFYLSRFYNYILWYFGGKVSEKFLNSVYASLVRFVTNEDNNIIYHKAYTIDGKPDILINGDFYDFFDELEESLTTDWLLEKRCFSDEGVLDRRSIQVIKDIFEVAADIEAMFDGNNEITMDCFIELGNHLMKILNNSAAGDYRVAEFLRTINDILAGEEDDEKVDYFMDLYIKYVMPLLDNLYVFAKNRKVSVIWRV